MALSDTISGFGVDLGFISGVSGFFLSLIMFVVFATFMGFITYFIANRRVYNRKIHKFEEVSGSTVPVGEDKAREIVLPFTSIRAFFLKNHKVYLPRPSLQTGKNNYWYAVRRDGEWVNVKPKFNEDTSEVDLVYDHSDMRMANASLKKLVEKNYKKLNWLKEYAPYIGFGILILMLGISAYLFFNEAGKVITGLSASTQQIANAVESLNEILNSLDNIATSSGIRPLT